MVNIFRCGEINGSHLLPHLRSFLQDYSYNDKTRVSEFISQDSATRRTQIIDAIFLPHEADLIKSIPLSLRLPKDKLVWAATSNGLFTIRSAYKLAVESSRPSNGGTSSDSSRNRRFWKLLWSLQIPHKVRHIAWRACRGIFPTKENLLRRGIQVDGCCDECGEDVESLGHLFWSCQRARDVWQCTRLCFKFDWAQVNSFFDLLWLLLVSDSYDEGVAELAVTLAWAIWFNCNEVRHGGNRKSGLALVQWTRQYLQEYHEATQVTDTPVIPQVVGWSPPSRSRYKINVEGAVFSAQKSPGVGVLIRDSEGQVIAALSKKINAPLGALEMEARAFEAGLEFARDIILEGNSLGLYNALCGLSVPPSTIAAIVRGVLMSCGSVGRVDFSHVKR